MNISQPKLFLRHSGTQAELNNKIYKNTASSYTIFAARRVNTQIKQKPTPSKKYLLKKGFKIVQNFSKNSSKQNCNSYQNIKYLDRSTINEWYAQGKAQNINNNINKRIIYKFDDNRSKIHELDKLIRKKDTRITQYPKRYTNLKTEQNNEIQKQKHKQILSYTRQIMNSSMLLRRCNRLQTSINQQSKYQILTNKLLGAGTFGKVYAAVDKATGQKVAIKKVFNDKTYKCRQIQLMQNINSKFVVSLLHKYNSTEDEKGQIKQYINIVMPKYESSFFDYIKPLDYQLSSRYLKIYLYQMFRGILHLHSRGICHRDLKPQNILIKNNRLAICDLGSAKILRKDEPNISYICSRCYRAPELIFGVTNYGCSIDMWSAGCIILQIMHKAPFFIAKDSLHHLIQIMKVMGTPTKKQIISMNPNYDVSSYDLPSIKKTPWKQIFPQSDSQLVDLVSKIMIYNPSLRLTAQQALQHAYFNQIRDINFLASFGNQIETSDFFSFDQRQINFMENAQLLCAKL